MYTVTKNTIAFFFGKFVFVFPLSLIETSNNLLIIGIMHMCTFANNYSNCVNSKCFRVIMLLVAAAYILEYSRKRNVIKRNIYDGLLLIPECNFEKEIFVANFFH